MLGQIKGKKNIAMFIDSESSFAGWLGLTQYEWFSKKSAERDARLAREAEEKVIIIL